MSDTPKFEVIDRRKMKKEEEQEAPSSQPAATPTPEPEQKAAGPRLVETEPAKSSKPEAPVEAADEDLTAEMPPPPTADEKREQESAYEASAQRV